MIDISHKTNTLRIAKAQAIVKVNSTTITAIKKNEVPKGNVFEASKVAALFAVKNTSAVLPHCHPIPVEFTEVGITIFNNTTIQVLVTVKTVYKTGCEMEALHGASVAALTMYDMLKPIDKTIEITSIKLLEKSGGKSDYKHLSGEKLSAAVIVISDSVFAKTAEDKSGKFLIEQLKELNFSSTSYKVVPDEADKIQSAVKSFTSKKTNLILTTGGTGASPRDRTSNAIKPLLTKELWGITETARNYGQQRMPYSMLSEGVSGFIDDSLIVCMPGSLKAVKEYMESLFPFVLHAFDVRKMKKHNTTN